MIQLITNEGPTLIPASGVRAVDTNKVPQLLSILTATRAA